MFRILTENKNVDRVKKALIRLGLDFTVYYSEGAWHGLQEGSMAIDLDNISRNYAWVAALMIKKMNGQQAVLLQEIPARSDLI